MLPSKPEMYRAICERNTEYAGVFYIGVRTTGIFCRPGCPARIPKLENIEFFTDPKAALHAGYRPCKRCTPMDPIERAPDWVQSLRDKVERNPLERITESELRTMGIEPNTVRRYFKSHYGMTFQEYHRARRMGLALAAVKNGKSALESGIDAGYESGSGFREAFHKMFGAPPSGARSVETLSALWIESPLGPLLAVANEKALCLLEFVDRRMLKTQIERVRKLFDSPIVPIKNAILEQAESELSEYFGRKRTKFTMPLDLRGTEFQNAVWQRLLEIPFGETRSYADIANAIGNKQSVRAIGRANGDNRIAIIVPCHRVIRSDGDLCGYGGGIPRKRWLLEHESAQERLLFLNEI